MARTPYEPHAVRILITTAEGDQAELGAELLVRPTGDERIIELALLYPPITIMLPLAACADIWDIVAASITEP